MPAVQAVQEGLLGLSMTPEAAALRQFRVGDEGTLRYRRDASDIFGAGTTRAMYDDPATGGYMEMLERPGGPASTLELFVPEDMRGKGGGRRLLEEVMQNSPRMMGQVSSKAAAKTAYDAGRRPANMPNATLDDVFRMIDEDSSVNLMSQAELAARGILAPTDPATARGQEIMGMLTSGRAGEVTDQMLDLGDPVLNTRLNEYLYSNYDLPMDTASRMGRAQEMGLDQQYFKGMYPYDPNTGPVRNYKGVEIERIGEKPVELQAIDRPSDFPTFIRGEDGYRIAGVMGRDPAVASGFAAWPESAVFPLQTRHGRTFTLDAAGDRAGNTHFYESGKPFRDAMRSGDYDTGVITNTADEGDIAFALRPENIRSIFARFDPRLSHLRNLNAALTAGVPLGLLAMQPEQEQY
jgi:GNAT superfamily N-acetyltransferase